MLKRILETVFASLMLVALSPLLIIIAILIRREDDGPALFLQQRVGRNKIPFTIYKFRTFHQGEITKIGVKLRKKGLDEVPQLINIVLGNMSFIGPRPLCEDDITRLGWHQPYYQKRWHINPGVTGLAQIYAGVNKKISWFYEQMYLNNPGLKMELKILALTVAMCFIDKYQIRAQLRRQIPRTVLSETLNLRS